MESLPEKVRLEAEIAASNLYPAKSKDIYNKEYSLYNDWKTKNGILKVCEASLLAYFSEKSRKYKSSSLWSQYSMLKLTLNIYENVDISKYCKLTCFLKQQHVGYEAKKSSIFSRDEINRFLIESSDDIFLLIKLVTVVAVSGGCRCDELVKMSMEHIEYKDDLLLFHLPYTKIHKKRSFIMLRNGFGINPIELYQKYIGLRPKNVTTNRLFLTYRHEACTIQPVGINSFGKMSTTIARFLQLKNPDTYTAHAFRRSAATLLAEGGSDITTLKRFGGWQSDKVAEGYVEDSIQQKVNIGKKILGENSTITCACTATN